MTANTINDLKSLNKFTSGLKEEDMRMPAFFIGHGSPMNGIEDNEFSREWRKAALEIPAPKAILVISAHWFTRGTKLTAMDFPETIHDFGGFPKALSEVQYRAPGSPELAEATAGLIKSVETGMDHEWGLDHGAWSVLRQMYPDANIPVVQLSIDYSKAPQYHFEIGKEIAALRKKGVLVVGSGNMVHNLRMVNFANFDGPGYDWAVEINEKFKAFIQSGDNNRLIRYDLLGTAARLAIPTPEHYLPLLYIMGVRDKSEKTSFFNDKAIAGSLTMTSVKIG